LEDTAMTAALIPLPRPPARLWGLWVVTHNRPEGFWWNHIHGSCERDDTPMTFISRDDALHTLSTERGELEEGDHMLVALIGVFPGPFPDAAEGS
jgi:hypothetical protein